jgi:hypothetical protein
MLSRRATRRRPRLPRDALQWRQLPLSDWYSAQYSAPEDGMAGWTGRV